MLLKKIEQFKTMTANMDTRVREKEDEARRHEAEKVKSEMEYRQMLSDDASSIRNYSDSDLNSAKMKMDQLEAARQVAVDRAAAISDAKIIKQNELLVEVREAYHAEDQTIADEVMNIFKEAKEYRAKMLAVLQKGHAKLQASHALRMKLNEIERICKTETITSFSLVPNSVPATTGGSIYTPLDYGVLSTEEELDRAYRLGQLPHWVEHFLTTGDLISNQEAAIQQRNESKHDDSAQGQRSGLLGRLFPKKDGVQA